jgi:hypothetical protein
MAKGHYATGYAEGEYFTPLRCTNCISKNRDVKSAPEMGHLVTIRSRDNGSRYK